MRRAQNLCARKSGLDGRDHPEGVALGRMRAEVDALLTLRQPPAGPKAKKARTTLQSATNVFSSFWGAKLKVAFADG